MKNNQPSPADLTPEDKDAGSAEAQKKSPVTTQRPAGVDARDEDPSKLKQNRDKLGVDEDHLTPDMKKGHRGTYP